MSQADLVASFQAISGRDENLSRSFLTRANWNLEQALSNYFESGSYGDDVQIDNTPVLQPQVPASSQIAPAVEPVAIIPPSIIDSIDDLATKIGLFAKADTSRSIALRGIQVDARVVDGAADVSIGMKYANNTTNPVEAVFLFAQDDSTIYGLTVHTDGKTIEGVCKEKEEAAAMYDDSIASAHSAFLLEKDDNKDMFKLSVGNLAPNQEATVYVKYVTELQAEGDSLKLSLPVTRMPLIRVDGSQSEARGEGENIVRDGLHVKIDVRSTKSRIAKVDKDSGHAVEVEQREGGAVVTFDSSRNDASSFETLRVLITHEDPKSPQLCFEPPLQDKGEGAVMLAFYPAIKAALKKAKGDFEEEDYEPFCEFIFLVDRSGSMAGSRMNQAKNALHLFLRSLPEGTQFNIIGFGSTSEKLFPSAVEYNDRTFKAASDHVDAMQASLGGTDILPPLRDILGNEANPDYPRQVFCLTDGEVNNTETVIDYVAKSAKGTRIFTFGIGADASPQLVHGLAKTTKGEAEFVASGTRLEGKVLRQLQRALQPSLKNATLHWGSASLHSSVHQSPTKLPPLFDGERVVVYALLDSEVTFENLDGASIILKAKTADSNSTELEFPLVIDGRSIVGESEGIKNGLVHRLAASALLKQLSPDDAKARANKEEITRLGVKYSLATRYTSFVASHERKEAVEGTMHQVQVNDQLDKAIMREEDDDIAHIQSDVAEVKDIFADLSSLVQDQGVQLERLDAEESRASIGGARSDSASGGGGGGLFGSLGRLVFAGKGSAAPAPAPARARQSHAGPGSAAPRPEPQSNRLVSLSSSLSQASPAPQSAPASKSYGASLFGLSAEGFAPPPPPAGAAAPAPAAYPIQLQYQQQSQPAFGYGGLPSSTPTSTSVAAPVFKSSAASGYAGDDLDDLLTGFAPQKAMADSRQDECERRSSSPKLALRGFAEKKEMKSKDKDMEQNKARSSVKRKKQSSIESELLSSLNRNTYGEEKKSSEADLCNIDEAFSAEGASSDLSAEEEDMESEAFAGFTYHADKADVSSSRSSVLSSASLSVAKPKPTNAQMRPLDRLVQLQGFKGSWSPSAELSEVLALFAKIDATVVATLPSELAGASASSDKADAWATALALAVLEEKCGDVKQEWSLLAQKAQRWLRTFCRQNSVDLATLQASARTRVLA